MPFCKRQRTLEFWKTQLANKNELYVASFASFIFFFNMIPLSCVYLLLAGKSGLAADFPLTLLKSKTALPAVSLVKMIPGLPLLSFHLITIGQLQQHHHHQMLKVWTRGQTLCGFIVTKNKTDKLRKCCWAFCYLKNKFSFKKFPCGILCSQYF